MAQTTKIDFAWKQESFKVGFENKSKLLSNFLALSPFLDLSFCVSSLESLKSCKLEQHIFYDSHTQYARAHLLKAQRRLRERRKRERRERRGNDDDDDNETE